MLAVLAQVFFNKQKKRRTKRLFFHQKLFDRSTTKSFVKTINTTSGVNHLLLSGIERVTFGTDFQMDILANGGASLNDIATATGSRYVLILGMNVCFHSYSVTYCLEGGESYQRILDSQGLAVH